MIFAIGDLHFDNTGDKPMGIFGDNWLNHEEKIIDNWRANIKEDDLVLLAGDISWALKLEEAYEDLLKIDELPGKKIIIKGNHDYWWNSLRKLNNLGLKTINFLQNNSYIYDNIGIVGTRGWSSIDVDTVEDQDYKVFNRELNRLKLSLDSLRESVEKIIVVLHYPPFNIDCSPNGFIDIVKEYNGDICVYGHLHSEGHKYAVEGVVEGIEVHCISSDYIDFIPKKIL
ncbi:metallophosphoesterase [Tissierella carlieri]|uniref:Metallophosphoesterase n=1 Tax=Tissierella carlieri TaxID=689904 RepID=A0ABT1S8D0_9FIRM|nr:metallophosphoesterase [Tissierella carlieri]MCQ4922722.1 metallophosphoesterase [Tissierella carlieri]MDU5082266.1 metallophosphoesterase [Bacillota bacterium]